MKPDSSIENKIEVALTSMDGLARATPSAFFYAKVLARLNYTEQTIWEKFNVCISRPTIAFATICVIIIMNLVAVYSNTSTTNTSVSEINEIAAADEYTQVSSTFYDLENLKP